MEKIEFEKFEVWDGFWCFRPIQEIDLRILEKLSYSSRSIKGKREIWVQKNEEQETPTQYQIDTLNFLKNHQNEVIESTFSYYKNVILPVYQDATDIDEKDIAYKSNELSKVFGILFIKIPPLENSKHFNYIIEFDFNYDDEHGTSILYQNEKAIDFFEGGEDNYDATKLYEEQVNNGQEIRTNLYQLNGETVFREHYKYDERIIFNLKSGTYRTFIQIGDREICRNFYVPKDLNEFSLREILTNE